MIIKELNHKPEIKIKDCIVALSYDEVRDVANGFYQLCKMLENADGLTDCDKRELENYKKVKNSFAILFDLVKHGQVQQFTIDYCANPSTPTCPADCCGAVKANIPEDGTKVEAL